MLKKILTGAAAALTLGGAVLATATPASAQHFRGGFHHGGRGGAVLGAGILGLAVGASLAGPGYYGPSYYGPDYYYGPPPGAYYGPSYYGYYGGHHRYWRWDAYHRRYY
jgi:hypothetical protein